jgi:hypothetical protein
MTARKALNGRGSGLRRGFGVLICFLLFVIGVQMITGVYRGEAGHQHDEAAHFMSALMMRDYAVSGFHTRPFAYAEQYYLHYPKFAIGMFPPFFHILLAGWLLAGPGTYSAALVFIALITASMAALIRGLLIRQYGGLLATSAACVVIFLPIVRDLTSEVMLDGMIALFGLLVVLATSRLLDSESVRDGVWLGLAGAAGCMVKGNGVGALLCPALAVLFTRRWGLLRKPPLYIAAGIVILLGGPVDYWSLRTYQKNLSFVHGGIEFTKMAAGAYAKAFWACGHVALLVALIGMMIKGVELKNAKKADSLWVSAFSLLIGTLLFHLLVPQPPDWRYTTTALAASTLFLPAAVARLGNAKGALALACVSIFLIAIAPHWEQPMGYRETAAWLHNRANGHPIRVLAVSEALGEGALVVATASEDAGSRPLNYVVRASKLLARSDWNSTYYSLRYKQTTEIIALLEDLGIRYIVLDRTPEFLRAAHQRQVAELVEEQRDRMSVAADFPPQPNVRSRWITIYELKYPAAVPRRPLRYSVESTLGREIGE